MQALLFFSRAKIAGLIVEIRIGQTGARIAMTDIDIDGLKDQNSRTLFFLCINCKSYNEQKAI